MRMNAYENYAVQSIQTAAPDKLLLMLFDGALKFGRQARLCIEDKNIEGANTNLLKIQAIISELTVTLNMDYAVSSNLVSLYDYMKGLLTQANIKKDVQPLDEVMSMLEELRDTFKQAAIIAKGGLGKAPSSGLNMEG